MASEIVSYAKAKIKCAKANLFFVKTKFIFAKANSLVFLYIRGCSQTLHLFTASFFPFLVFSRSLVDVLEILPPYGRLDDKWIVKDDPIDSGEGCEGLNAVFLYGYLMVGGFIYPLLQEEPEAGALDLGGFTQAMKGAIIGGLLAHLCLGKRIEDEGDTDA